MVAVEGLRSTIVETQDAKMTNELKRERLISAGAERMRLHRERRRRGLRSLTVDVRETEIDALVHRGLLQAEERDDMYAVRKALYQHLNQTLGATS
jgi:hypothetical protein